ncbi:hypothetical protein CTA2_7023 [Colletotrichum tanaceti]|uniref:Protein kinase domain-containing protein n=1 Tax=Colletotrichum tanaceti TaxID=1306861 RepID=A0A4U6XEA4_9PEZI|nr:hypothetical protein CTA2_7023 [Colletotrichum tanaceti]TKW54138.1 hypothetical protein CTA1_6425 [Colletotrichum tanaceti]
MVNANVRLLACLVDEDDTGDSDYRFLVDGQHVKYVSTTPGTFAGREDDRTFEPLLLSELFPPFPAGNWNSGHATGDPETGEATFDRTERVQFPGEKSLWHPVVLDELDFTRQDRMNQRPVLVKLAVWPWEIPYAEAETAAYQWLSDSGIGPRFLGHLAEGRGGRVIGFVAEWLDDARAAGPGDIDACKKALGRLHDLGIKLGDVNRHNFLVREGHDVVLIDFETTERDCSPVELGEEMDKLGKSLQGE